jgi:hypothetical protein
MPKLGLGSDIPAPVPGRGLPLRSGPASSKGAESSLVDRAIATMRGDVRKPDLSIARNGLSAR